MVKLDMFCGLLGVGKTTLIKQMLCRVYSGHKVAIIENEFGKVNLDAAELESASIQVRELTSGCICCTVKGDLADAVALLIAQEDPEYILVEASGVADLRSLLQVCTEVEGITINRVITVVHGNKIVKLLRVVGNFFYDQIRVSDTIYLNFCEKLTPEEIDAAKAALLEINPELMFITVPLENIRSDTFPERKGASPSRQVSTPKAFGRFAVGRSLGQLRRREASAGPNLDSWEFTFAAPFTQSRLEKLLSILQDNSHHILWRAKGYLEMTDGTVQKVDYTFGDTFRVARNTAPENHKNLLVLIGPNLDIRWLEQQFEELTYIE